MTVWLVPIVIAVISLLGVVFVPVFITKRSQKLSDQQLENLKKLARDEADKREERLRNRWQETADDVDYLWEFYQDQIVPWMRAAYTAIHDANPDFPQPPALKPRPGKETHHSEARLR